MNGKAEQDERSKIIEGEGKVCGLGGGRGSGLQRSKDQQINQRPAQPYDSTHCLAEGIT